MVSFIVPCYNYAHFLRECVSSILRQSYPQFEILIMDDQSPDNTPEVAGAFGDARVIHVRNERNLGLVSNVNKGLGLARGEFVWAISPDDNLRNPHALERFVGFIDRHPDVGFVFSPVVHIRKGKEGGSRLKYAEYGSRE